MRKIVITVVAILFSGILSFCILHSTPTLALRTYLFMKGYHNITIHTKITETSLDNRPESKSNPLPSNKKYYQISEAPLDIDGNHMYTYVLTKEGFLYYAKYHGEI